MLTEDAADTRRLSPAYRDAELVRALTERDLERRCRALAELIHDRDAMIDELLQQRANPDARPLRFPISWALTRSEECVLQTILAAAPAYSHPSTIAENLRLELGSLVSSRGDFATVKVFLVRVRRKLKEAGVPGEIQCVWSRGYRVDSQTKLAIERAAFEAFQDGDA
jgi:hypothetical protein